MQHISSNPAHKQRAIDGRGIVGNVKLAKRPLCCGAESLASTLPAMHTISAVVKLASAV